MRILFIVHQFMPDYAGGTERVTLNLARAAQAEGDWAEVLTVSQTGGPGWRVGADGLLTSVTEGVPVTAIPALEQPLMDVGFWPNEERRARVENFLDTRPAFDVAHVTHAFRATEAVEVLAARGIPYVWTLTDFFSLCYRINLVRQDGRICRGPEDGRACAAACPQSGLPDDSYRDRTRRYGELMERAAAVVAVSEYVAERVRAEHPALRLFVVPNGVDLLRFEGPAAAGGDRPLTFGYVGTVSEAKGALHVARAFAEARLANARLRIVGPCFDDRLAADIRNLSADISVEPPVPAARVPELLAEFDVLTVPSQVPESFSLALHEGFAAGLPAIVSDLGNVGAVVGATGAGLAVPADDQSAWAGALRAATDAEARAAWSGAAPLPWRIEEETFLYKQLYRAASRPVTD